ncbi:MAG: FecR domain-containing protein [Desulfobacterales bacterium]|nr:FecR domain-containing protein [Desulfobacterales bacterium]
MSSSIKKSFYVVFTAALLLIKAPFFNTDAFSEPLVPEGLVIQEKFAPGAGKPIGNIQFAQGKVIIIHAGLSHGYLAKEKTPLFKGDTIIAMERARARFRLNDGSTLTMASKTKLVINKSIYDPSGKRRSSFISMGFGKARFWVRKLVGFKEPEFKVKTKTAVIGVRGSDFVIKSTQNMTEVTTLENTLLEVVSMTAIEAPPIVLSEFERITIEADAYPSPVIDVPQKEVEEMMMEMMITIAERAEPVVDLKIQKEDVEVRKPDEYIEESVDKAGQPEPIEEPETDEHAVTQEETEPIKTYEESHEYGSDHVKGMETELSDELSIETETAEGTESPDELIIETGTVEGTELIIETETVEGAGIESQDGLITDTAVFEELPIEENDFTDIIDQVADDSKELIPLPGPPED